VNRPGSQLDHIDIPLKSLGIRLPSFRIADTFQPHLNVPSGSPALKLKSILPDFAGFRLEDLLGDVKFPTAQSDAVRITHGLEPVTRLPWVQCDVDLPLDSNVALFQLQPVELRLERPHLWARTRVGSSGFGEVRRTVEATLTATWVLLVGGQPIVSLRNAVARFDETGRLRFEIAAGNVALHENLRFLTDLLAAVRPGSDSGLSIDVLRVGSLPIGVRARLDLAAPAVQTGAFSISNLAISTFVELAARIGFEIAFGFSLASRDRPFNLSILCLGGGGWLTIGARYRVGARPDAQLSIGLSAGASLPFDIGVASGGVSLLVSLSVEWSSGTSAGLAIVLRAMLSGELQILGIISVSLTIALEARYQSGGALVCRGILRIKIKICWFIKIDLSADFSLTLAGRGGNGPRALKDGEAAPEQDYVNSFGGW